MFMNVHDNDEGDWSKDRGSIVDAELSGSRGEGEKEAITNKHGILGHEQQGGVEDSLDHCHHHYHHCQHHHYHYLLQQRHARHEAGEEVDPRHHLVAGHLVLFEQSALAAKDTIISWTATAINMSLTVAVPASWR